MAQIKFKRGDTFALACLYKVDGVPTSVSSIDIDSQIRDSRGMLIQELTVNKLVPTGSFALSSTSYETSQWPVSVLRCDIQFSESGSVRSTQTFEIVVIEDITK